MWGLATMAGGKPALVVDGKLYPLAALAASSGKALPSSSVAIFADWERSRPALAGLAASAVKSGVAPVEEQLAAPLLYPGKVLCAGANYYDHMAEMGFPGVKKETQRLFFFF
jgi:2-keto-4-pentenoate hydratase/2-oxohepta-3-ene-1,7-dioic acid hydratase in catechol pathway